MIEGDSDDHDDGRDDHVESEERSTRGPDGLLDQQHEIEPCWARNTPNAV
jgi:hypothetical protein